MTDTGMTDAGGDSPRRLCVCDAGFLRRKRLRRILGLAGWRLVPGLPRGGDHVAAWGQTPGALRAERIAARRAAPLLRIEPAFLGPNHDPEPPIGLLLDRSGVHFDARAPSDLETLLATHPLDDHVLLERARGAIARMRSGQMTGSAAQDPALPAPDPGYVLVIDQPAGDASVMASGADRTRFREMLYWAQEEHPGARIVIHMPGEPGARSKGHFRKGDAGGRIALHTDPVSPWALLDGAVAVYTVSAQMGFQAILAGHRPRVFGTPFYAGWGLSDDDTPVMRRTRTLTRTQLFAAAMILYPTWYDPCRDRLCSLEETLAHLEAQARAWREDRHGWVATGVPGAKRAHLQKFFGAHHPVVFADTAAQARARADVPTDSGRTPPRIMAWASTATDTQAARVEDGFLRPQGAGAPLSMICDPMGFHDDASRPSALEKLIADAPLLRDDALLRAERLAARLVALEKPSDDLPPGHRILVPGQPEDGGAQTMRNAELLERARAENPGAVILWRPHPDAPGGQPPGAIDALTVTADMGALLGAVDELWTISAPTGFQALLRGLPVTTLGAPFYAGWGLTRDLGPVPARRLSGPRPTLAGLVHAALIDYPRYRDPVTGLPCPPEVIVDRLAAATGPRGAGGGKLRALLAGLAKAARR